MWDCVLFASGSFFISWPEYILSLRREALSLCKGYRPLKRDSTQAGTDETILWGGNTAWEPLNLNHSTRRQVPEDINLYFETYIYIYVRTYSMVQSPSRKANWFAASQEIPLISRNPKVHYRTHKRPSPVSILGQLNPIHIPTSHLLEIRPIIIHQSTLRSPQRSPYLRFPHQDPIHPLSSPIRATCPAHLILLDFITRTILGEKYKSFSSSLCNLLHSPVTSSHFITNMSSFFFNFWCYRKIAKCNY